MFYHATLLFDYKGFAQEAIPLAYAIEHGDLEPVYLRVKKIVNCQPSSDFFLRNYGYGGPIRSPKSIAEVQSSPYKNSEIGQWFVLIMSTYLRPCPSSIGYNWSNLASALEQAGWELADVRKLCHGLPTGLLLTSAASAEHLSVVKHDAPYWQWTRLLYTYNQGGWLSFQECERLYHLLGRKALQIPLLHYKEEHELTGDQFRTWKISVAQGCADALAMLSSAIGAKSGLYMVILWQWGEDNDES